MGTRIAAITFFDELSATYGEVPTGIVVTVVTVCAAFILNHQVSRILHTKLGQETVGELSILINIVRVVTVIVVVLFLGENVFHVEMRGAVQALGITTLVVSLGLQDLIKSIVAGVLIVVGNIVSKGDQVIMGDHRGEVMDIDWHQITIRDRDGVRHIIPNSAIMSDSFMRVRGKMACRHIFECDVAPGANLQLVKTDIEAIAGNVLLKHGWNADGLSPQVLFLGSNAFGTSASIRIFISDIEYATAAMNAVMIAISNRGYLADTIRKVNDNWKAQ